nr:immunoglobulin light chain junction region [Macaca mulatta]
CQQYNNLPLAF